MISEFIEAAVSITDSIVDVRLRSEGEPIELKVQDPFLRYPLHKTTACYHEQGLTPATRTFFENICASCGEFIDFSCFLASSWLYF